jgi:predicted kinase
MTSVSGHLSRPFAGFWLEAPLPILLDRVRKRSGDVSDADAAVFTRQASWKLEHLTRAVSTLQLTSMNSRALRYPNSTP